MRRSRIIRLIFQITAFAGMAALPLVTFVFGVFLTIAWQELVSPPTVSLCQLGRSPYYYSGRTVRVEADSFGGFGAVFIADKGCGETEVSAAGVWLADGYEPSTDVQTLYAESEKETYRPRILVTGRFDPEATPGCFAPKAAIRATNIELISEITAETIEKRVR